MPTTRSALKKQEREYHNSHQHVNRPPPEILSQIFILCNQLWSSTFGDGGKSFTCQARIPAVCRLWRKVALDTTALWTRVTLSNSVSYHHSALYLSRSGSTAPLDIEIDVTEPFRTNAGEVITLQECVQRAENAFTFIVDHGGVTSRWRSRWIQGNVFHAHLAAINFIRSSLMPSLQYLEMEFLGPAGLIEEDYLAFAHAPDSPPKLLFHDSPPTNLCTAKLAGVPNPYLFGHSAHPQLAGLTRLELEFVTRYPDLGDIHKMLAACPDLVVLCLNSASIDEFYPNPRSKIPGEQLPRIRLPELQALSLWLIVSPEWELGVLAMLDAPKLKVLRLSADDYLEEDEHYPPMIDLLARGSDKENPKPHFPALTHLFYNMMPDPTEDLRLLLAAYPGIESISLPMGLPLTALLDRPWLAPNLTRLRVQMISDLKKLVAARSKAGLPLKVVEINWPGFGPFVQPQDKKQLEKWVDSVTTTGFIHEHTRVDPMTW